MAAVLLIAAVIPLNAAGRRVAFRAEDGGTVSGLYFEPAQAPSPAVILLHMLGRSHADWDGVASQLAGAGFAVLAVDFRGGDPKMMAADVKAAKAFLRARPDIALKRLGIAGASVGANAAAIDAADDTGIASLALVSPGVDYKGLRTEAPMRKYGARPALFIASTRDPYARRSVRHLITLGSGQREVRYTDAVGHGTTLIARDPELGAALVDWFRRTL